MSSVAKNHAQFVPYADATGHLPTILRLALTKTGAKDRVACGDSRDRGQFLDLVVDRMALGDHLVDETKGPRVLSRHEIVTVEGPLDGFVVLPGAADIDLIQPSLHLDDVLGVALDVARLTLEAARGLVQHNSRIGERIAHALLAGGKEQRAHRGCLTDAEGRDRRS